MPKQQGETFYAVKGKKTGVYSSWSECQEQIEGVDKPVFRKFQSLEEAQMAD
jgi:viroplasmin and RNaseH domain-containing protein